jgi:hypothetical protein
MTHRPASQSGVTLVVILLLVLAVCLVALWIGRSGRSGDESPSTSPSMAAVEDTAVNAVESETKTEALRRVIAEAEEAARELEGRVRVAVDDLNSSGPTGEIDAEQIDQLIYELEREAEMRIARAYEGPVDPLKEARIAQQLRVAHLRSLLAKLEAGEITMRDIKNMRDRATTNSY